MKSWPLLEQFQKQGVLAPLDLYYARRAAHYLGGLPEEEAAVLAAAMAAARQGHLCIDRSGEIFLLEESNQCAFRQLLEKGFASIKSNPFLHVDNGRAYLPKNWALEETLRLHLARLASNHGPTKIPDFPLLGRLNDEQKQAVSIAMQHTLSLVTGGPGTGKTFTAAAIVQAFLASDPSAKVILTAPTARAADHLKNRLLDCSVDSNSLLYSGTLHSLLGVKNIKQPPPFPFIGAQLIIVDECSMIDAELFAALLAALPEGSAIVLMGDPDQLHPVGIGSLFADLVQADLPMPFGRAHLQRCLRVEDRPLLELTAAVQNGKPCAWPLLDWPVDMQHHEEFYEKLWELAKSCWPKPSPQAPEPGALFGQLARFRILSVLRQGPFGTEALNEWLAGRFRAQMRQGDWWTAPIQITRNDSATGLCNGELGVLVRSRSENYALFPGHERPLPATVLPAFDFAFCSSVHKSQGSEYEEILLIVPPGSESFGREMLYTAITRAKKRLSIASAPDILATMQKHRSRKLSGFLKRETLNANR